MKYFFAFFMVIVICSCAVFTARRGLDNGVNGEIFEGVGQGFRGPITVQVRLNEGCITEIEIIDSAEDRFVGGAAMEELTDIIIIYNSTDIDAVSGATESSIGFIEAIQNAILKK
jgi:urocanate reductase